MKPRIWTDPQSGIKRCDCTERTRKPMAATTIILNQTGCLIAADGTKARFDPMTGLFAISFPTPATTGIGA